MGPSQDILVVDGQEEEEEEEWEVVPAKSKGRKHGAEADANASAPPSKELRAADSLSSDGSGLPPVVSDGAQPAAQAPASQGANDRLRAPRSGRRGRNRGRGAAAARQQRMGPIQEGPEGHSPPHAQPVGTDFASENGDGGCSRRPPPRERGTLHHGPPRRLERRARPVHAPGQDGPPHHPHHHHDHHHEHHHHQHRDHHRSGGPEMSASVLPGQGAFEGGRGRGRIRSVRGRGGSGPPRGGRGGGPMGQQAPSDKGTPSSDVAEAQEAVGQEGGRFPRFSRGRGRGRGRGGHGRHHDHHHAGAKVCAANVSAVPYVSAQDG